MNECWALGNMTTICDIQSDASRTSYIPHNADTTKFWAVFKPFAKSSNVVSVNDTQLIAPIIQDCSISLILPFRQHYVALSADVELIHQVSIDERHQTWQKMLLQCDT